MKKIILFSMLLPVSTILMAQNNQPGCYPFPKTISVTGSSEMEIIPDEIYVQVDLREYKKSGDKVELEQIKSAFLRNCKSVGLADSVVSIASYEGYNGNWWKKRKKDVELYASITYQVKFSDSRKMDELVKLLDDDATTNFSIIRTSHSKIQEFRKQLKILAIKAAKDKGIYLTEAIGEKLGEAISIEEPSETSLGYYNNSKSNAANAVYKQQGENYTYMLGFDDGTNQIDFKKMKFKYEVKMVFAIK